jgi:hypothetical protein
MVTNTTGPREQPSALAHNGICSHTYHRLPVVVMVPKEEG